MKRDQFILIVFSFLVYKIKSIKVNYKLFNGRTIQANCVGCKIQKKLSLKLSNISWSNNKGYLKLLEKIDKQLISIIILPHYWLIKIKKWAIL